MTDSTELRLAKMYREEGDKLREQANADLEAARYERGQAEHAKRLTEQMERSIAAREQKLKELGEPELVAREQAVAEREQAVAEREQAFDKGKYEALINLNQSFERDKREREAAGIGN
jgi:hypothetical protein